MVTSFYDIFTVRYYLQDYDWRVREATFRTHKTFLEKMGKNVAPHLKVMMPTWLLSLYDPYAPAASSAKTSFNTIFPDDKQKNVIGFTKNEVFNVSRFILITIAVDNV